MSCRHWGDLLTVWIINKLTTLLILKTPNGTFLAFPILSVRHCALMWNQKLGIGRHTGMRDSSLIHPQFWINTFQSKNSVIFMCMLVRQMMKPPVILACMFRFICKLWNPTGQVQFWFSQGPLWDIFLKTIIPLFLEAMSLFSYIA